MVASWNGFVVGAVIKAFQSVSITFCIWVTDIAF